MKFLNNTIVVLFRILFLWYQYLNEVKRRFLFIIINPIFSVKKQETKRRNEMFCSVIWARTSALLPSSSVADQLLRPTVWERQNFVFKKARDFWSYVFNRSKNPEVF